MGKRGKRAIGNGEQVDAHALAFALVVLSVLAGLAAALLGSLAAVLVEGLL
jgi:hypothetical protein